LPLCRCHGRPRCVAAAGAAVVVVVTAAAGAAAAVVVVAAAAAAGIVIVVLVAEAQRGGDEKETKSNHNEGCGSFSGRTAWASHFMGPPFVFLLPQYLYRATPSPMERGGAGVT